MQLEQLAKQVEQHDMQWIHDFEVAVIRASFDVGLTSALKKTNDLDEVAKLTNIEARIIKTVLPVLVHAGALKSDKTPPSPRGPLRIPRILKLFSGGTAFLMGEAKSYSEMWEAGTIDRESAMSFSKAMYHDTRLPAQIHCSERPFANLSTLVDLGGGGGAWAAEALDAHPELEFIILDLEAVCAVTKEILNYEGRRGKPVYVSGSFFRDRPPAADAYLLSNILHDWTFDKCRTLLKHIHASTPSGAKLFMHECLLSEDKSGPRFTSIFHLLMLVNHSSQQFTESELSTLLQECGFSAPKRLSQAAHYSLLVSEKLAPKI